VGFRESLVADKRWISYHRVVGAVPIPGVPGEDIFIGDVDVGCSCPNLLCFVGVEFNNVD
jgi:hypothetical protein